ncbi:MAG: GIY-YIG nuclease family protein [Alphaproteobacteria bacterium]
MKQPAVYMIANKMNGTVYTGVTSNLIQRVAQHKNGDVEGFSKDHNCKILVYYETHETMESAILREKQIKAGSRKAKLALIECANSGWNDLYGDLV